MHYWYALSIPNYVLSHSGLFFEPFVSGHDHVIGRVGECMIILMDVGELIDGEGMASIAQTVI